MILVDSNIWIDIVTGAETWYDWSAQQLEAAAETSSVAINPLILAEVGGGLATAADLEAAIPSFVRRLPLPFGAAYDAGRVYRQYRRNGGVRPSLMPDFYIGAHAEFEGHTILTRDARRFRTYFPNVPLIAPDQPNH